MNIRGIYKNPLSVIKDKTLTSDHDRESITTSETQSQRHWKIIQPDRKRRFLQRARASISVRRDVSCVGYIVYIYGTGIIFSVYSRATAGKPRTRTRWVCLRNSHAARARRSVILKASALVKIVADSFLLSRVCRASNELH